MSVDGKTVNASATDGQDAGQSPSGTEIGGRPLKFSIRFVYTRKNNDILPYTHEHVITPKEAGELANVLNRNAKKPETNSVKGYALFKDFLQFSVWSWWARSLD